MPAVRNYDVVVAGAGIAGCAAAVAAARQGMRVALIEKQCMPGGLATSGMINVYLPLCDGYGNVTARGLAWEMMKRSVEYGPYSTPPGWNGAVGGDPGIAGNRFRCRFSPGGFALSLDKMLLEAGVELWLDTRIVAVGTEGKRIVSLDAANDSGIVRIGGRCFVDATGGAYLVRMAGGAVGHDENFMAAWWLDAAEAPEKFLLKAGVDVARLGTTTPEFSFGACRDGRDVTRFVRKAWSMIREMYDALPAAERKKNFPIQLPAMPQLRKIARIDALYNLSDADRGKHFDDSVGVVSDWRHAGPVWETPYRSLLPREVRGVLASGRCMGATGLAWEIYRVIPAAAVTGEAAGIAAALAVGLGCDPADVPVPELRSLLLAAGAIVDAGPEFGVDPGNAEKTGEYRED